MWFMISFSVLGSGSSGNATIIQGSNGTILLDCGFSVIQIKKRLELLGKDIEEIDAVFITHEHTDHICGLKRFTNTYNVPVFMTQGTFAAIHDILNNTKNIELFESGDAIRIGGFNVQSFAVTHDAQDPVNYVVSNSDKKIGVATDCGFPSKLLVSRLRGCHALILESNYCPQMLLRGPYPPQIKQRIQSKFGHLSNQQMLELLSKVMDETLSVLVLAHISENNNHHALVEQIAQDAIRGRNIQLWITHQTHPTPLIHLN